MTGPNELLNRSTKRGTHSMIQAAPHSVRAIFAAGLLGLTAMAVTVPAAVAAPATAPRTFKVGKQTFVGRPKTICEIEGKWSDGEQFTYTAWDTCAEMRVHAASLADYGGWAPRGRKGSPTVADIPTGSEVIEISNGYSSVLIYRDRRGDIQEVLIRD